MATNRGVQTWLILAAVAVLGQQALTTYPASQRGSGLFWLSLSFLLLWLVHRRSNVARILFAAGSAFGVAVFALSAIDNVTSTNALLALLYGVQAGTMLVAPVRSRTRAEPAGRIASQVG